MKRFFKKASLVLVALCLIVGSVLPSFASVVAVPGVVMHDESRDLDRGDGSTVNAYMYFCFTGTYETTANAGTAAGRNFAIRAICRGGNLDSHRTEVVVCAETEYILEGASGYYYEYRESDSNDTNSRYHELAIVNSDDPARQYIDGYSIIETTPIMGGERWMDIYDCTWNPDGPGWVED